MPNYDSWAPSGFVPINSTARAVQAWEMISHNSSSITLYRDGVAQTAQTVRIEYDSASMLRGDAGEAAERGLIVFGVKDHPSISDTDIIKGDQFAIGTALYEVEDVLTLPGEVQAKARRTR